MSARRLLLALGPTLLAASTGRATHVTGTTIGSTIQRGSELHNPFTGVEPVDINALAAAAIAVGATPAASGSCPMPDCGPTSGRALCIQTSRGGATPQGPGPNDYVSTLHDQSKPWWTKDEKTNRGNFFFMPKREPAAAVKKNAFSQNKATRDSRSGRIANVSESLSGGAWILLAALPAVLLRAKPNGDAKGVDQDPMGSRPPKAEAPVRSTSKTVQRKPSTTASPKGWSSKAVVVKKGSAKPQAGQGGDGASLVRALVPDNDMRQPYARAIDVVVLAALGSGGLYALKTGELLRAAWPIAFVDPWQVLTAVAWAVNMRVTLVEGRLDGSSQAKPSEAQPARFFTPASWAFKIWAPILLGEMLFILYQLLPLPSIRGAWWLHDVCPWFCGAMLFQSLWCASFRPWARDIGLLWLPTLLLGGVATALGGAHRVLREAWFTGDIEIPQYIIAHLPLSLHFGWISCASLVNLNGYFASVTSLSNRAKLALSLCTVVAAVVLGVWITLVSEDPVFPGVVAWALWAVGSEGGWRNLKGRVDPGAIRTQELVAKAGSIAAASVSLWIYLREMMMGGCEID